MSKCASTILLALSPIFIFFSLYDSTRGLFDSYIRQLIAYALIPIMTCAVLMILLSVSDVVMQETNQANTPSFAGLIPFGLMCVIQIYLLSQVKGKCAALAGGFVLPTVMSSLRQTKSDFGSVGGRLSGAANSSLAAGRIIYQGAKGAGTNIASRLGRFTNNG